MSLMDAVINKRLNICECNMIPSWKTYLNKTNPVTPKHEISNVRAHVRSLGMGGNY